MGGEAQLLRAAHQKRGDEEQQQRAEEGQRRHDIARLIIKSRVARQIEAETRIDIEAADGDPRQRRENGEDIRRAAGARLQRLENLADGAAVVIGRGAGGGRARRWRARGGGRGGRFGKGLMLIDAGEAHFQRRALGGGIIGG